MTEEQDLSRENSIYFQGGELDGNKEVVDLASFSEEIRKIGFFKLDCFPTLNGNWDFEALLFDEDRISVEQCDKLRALCDSMLKNQLYQMSVRRSMATRVTEKSNEQP